MKFTIAYHLGRGEYQSIEVEEDQYLVGQINYLINLYNTKEKASRLVDRADLTYLGTMLDKCRFKEGTSPRVVTMGVLNAMDNIVLLFVDGEWRLRINSRCYVNAKFVMDSFSERTEQHR